MNDSIAARYKKGQKVTIVPAKEQPLSPRDADIEPYIGQTGEITDYYWIRPGTGTRAFYLYIVRIGTSEKEVVVHEDEIEAHIE